MPKEITFQEQVLVCWSTANYSLIQHAKGELQKEGSVCQESLKHQNL
jgi:hypothetical protein